MKCFVDFIGALAEQKRSDANVTEEEIDTEFNDSEFESGGERGSIAFTINSSIPTLNPLDSSSDDYRFASGKFTKIKFCYNFHSIIDPIFIIQNILLILFVVAQLKHI